jgi:hypothetical protein
MTRLEVGIAQTGAQHFDEGEQIIGNGMNDCSHSHSNGGIICLVQAFSFILNNWRVKSSLLSS